MNASSSAIRTLFWTLAAALLLAGLFLYFAPARVATLPADVRGSNPWPWPIGPLAVRFIGSLLLSGALAAFLAARHPDLPTAAAFTSVLGTLSAWMALHGLVNGRDIDWSKPLGPIWFGAFAVLVAVNVALTLALRRRADLNVPPLPPTPAVAKGIALFIFILTGVVGAAMFFFPQFGRAEWPWDLANRVNVQFLGGVFLTISLSSLWSWLHPSWYGYDVFYPAAGLFATVALIAAFMHWELFAIHEWTRWAFVAIYILGAVMGFYPFFRHALRLRSPGAG